MYVCVLCVVCCFNRYAYYSIVGLCTIGFQVSYSIPLILKAWYNPADFPVTPKSLGSWSRPMAVISFLWLNGTACFFFFPTVGPVTTDTMNWVVVVIGGCMFLCGLNWVFNSRHHFKGPPRSKLQVLEVVEDPEKREGGVQLVPTRDLDVAYG